MKMNIARNIAYCLTLICLPAIFSNGSFSVPLFSEARASDVPVPVATDSRIKTFVYSENDVFNIVTHYGYQSNIEFGPEEEVQTISVGDRVPFQIVPAGRRLFVRAMATNARTNMTVVTTKHAYQFDLVSVPTPVMPNEELVYVVRFFYPGDKRNMPVTYTDNMSSQAPVSPPIQQQTPALPAPVEMPPSNSTTPINNYKYSFSGSDALAPLKIFDDGAATYFKLQDSSSQTTPDISVVGAGGKETPVSPRRAGEYWVVDTVAARFTIKQNGATVCVYNDRIAHP